MDPKIQIKYVDTKHQLADILTKGNFTRDEWNNLLYLFDIGHFSLICCSQNISSTNCRETMAKRMQEEKGEERIVATSKSTLNLVSLAATSSSTVQGPINCIEKVRGERLVLVAAEKDQQLRNFHENLKSTRKLVASGNSDIDGSGTILPHSLHISTAYVPFRVAFIKRGGTV